MRERGASLSGPCAHLLIIDVVAHAGLTESLLLPTARYLAKGQTRSRGHSHEDAARASRTRRPHGRLVIGGRGGQVPLHGSRGCSKAEIEAFSKK